MASVPPGFLQQDPPGNIRSFNDQQEISRAACALAVERVAIIAQQAAGYDAEAISRLEGGAEYDQLIEVDQTPSSSTSAYRLKKSLPGRCLPPFRLAHSFQNMGCSSGSGEHESNQSSGEGGALGVVYVRPTHPSLKRLRQVQDEELNNTDTSSSSSLSNITTARIMDEGPESHNNWPVDKKLNATKQTPSSRLSEMRSQLLASPGRSESCCSTLRLQLNISEQLVREVNMFLQKPPFESRPSDELQDTASDWANEDCGGDQGCRNKWEALELVREARATGSKVKASNLYVESLRIGGWQRVAHNSSDLVAKFYFMKRKLVWEVLECERKKKIEIQWSDIHSMRIDLTSDPEFDTWEIDFNCNPAFYREMDLMPKQHTLWESCGDFTGKQALKCWTHRVVFRKAQGFVKHFRKLLTQDSQLAAMMTLAGQAAATAQERPTPLPAEEEETADAAEGGHPPIVAGETWADVSTGRQISPCSTIDDANNHQLPTPSGVMSQLAWESRSESLECSGHLVQQGMQNPGHLEESSSMPSFDSHGFSGDRHRICPADSQEVNEWAMPQQLNCLSDEHHFCKLPFFQPSSAFDGLPRSNRFRSRDGMSAARPVENCSQFSRFERLECAQDCDSVSTGWTFRQPIFSSGRNNNNDFVLSCQFGKRPGLFYPSALLHDG